MDYSPGPSRTPGLWIIALAPHPPAKDYYGAEASLAVLGTLGVHRLDGSTSVRWRPTRLLRRSRRGRRHGLAHILLLLLRSRVRGRRLGATLRRGHRARASSSSPPHASSSSSNSSNSWMIGGGPAVLTSCRARSYSSSEIRKEIRLTGRPSNRRREMEGMVPKIWL